MASNRLPRWLLRLAERNKITQSSDITATNYSRPVKKYLQKQTHMGTPTIRQDGDLSHAAGLVPFVGGANLRNQRTFSHTRPPSLTLLLISADRIHSSSHDYRLTVGSRAGP